MYSSRSVFCLYAYSTKLLHVSKTAIGGIPMRAFQQQLSFRGSLQYTLSSFALSLHLCPEVVPWISSRLRGPRAKILGAISRAVAAACPRSLPHKIVALRTNETPPGWLERHGGAALVCRDKPFVPTRQAISALTPAHPRISRRVAATNLRISERHQARFSFVLFVQNIMYTHLLKTFRGSRTPWNQSQLPPTANILRPLRPRTPRPASKIIV